MYEIYADGNLLYSTAYEDEAHAALDVSPSLDIESGGTLSFVLPPGNAQYDSIKKLKSIITVHQDSDIIFRGRAVECETDIYSQKSVYCESDTAFLRDSLFKPGRINGKVKDFFARLISSHNGQVEPEKQFTVGVVNAVDDDEDIEQDSRTHTRIYWSTLDMIEDSLLSVYGGYLRTRTESGIRYIDWLDKSGEASGKMIEFSVNLLDLKDKLDASEVFTVLIPVGKSEIDENGEYGDPVTIESVNDGLNYIQNDEAVALYGKIWRTKSWNYIDSPNKLLKKAREYMKMGAEVHTLTLKAVDMHFIDGNAEAIRVGDHVRILSDPHGLDITIICTRINLDPINPEQTTYTFGEAPKELTDSVTYTEKEVNDLTGGGRGGGGRGIQEEASDIMRWARISVDEANAHINLNAGEINNIKDRVSVAEVDIDGLEGEIALRVKKEEMDELTGRVDRAESSIQINADSISSKVNKNGVISAINQTSESVLIQASRINLQGYVTATQLETELSDMQIALADSIVTSTLHVSSTASVSSITAERAVITTALRYGGHNMSVKSVDVVTKVSGSPTGSVLVTDEFGTGKGYALTGYKVTAETTTINYIGY